MTSHEYTHQAGVRIGVVCGKIGGLCIIARVENPKKTLPNLGQADINGVYKNKPIQYDTMIHIILNDKV